MSEGLQVEGPLQPPPTTLDVSEESVPYKPLPGPSLFWRVVYAVDNAPG